MVFLLFLWRVSGGCDSGVIAVCSLQFAVWHAQFAVCRGWLLVGGTWESSNCFLGAAETRELPLLVGAFPS